MLCFILRVVVDLGCLYFFIFDEMNFVCVECYFVLFLLVMEMGKEFVFYVNGIEVNDVLLCVFWPMNFYIVGIVNMDEMIYLFSDKVLDWVFMFEFWDVDLKCFFECVAVRSKGKWFLDVEVMLLELYDVMCVVCCYFGYCMVGEVLVFMYVVLELGGVM